MYRYYYYRFIVHFPIWLDFLFITFSLHFFLSWISSLSIFSSAITASTHSNHVLLGLPTGLLPSTLNSIHFFTQSSSAFLITCPYHLSLTLLMTVVIGSTSTSLPNSSFGQVGLGVGSWPSNRATEGSNPKGTRLYFVILLKNVEKIFDWH